MMIKAVLFDLDGTLLQNPTRKFLEIYFSAINRYFEDVLGTPDISDLLVKIVKNIMVGQRDMVQTNHALLLEDLSHELNISEERIQETLNHFYQTTYRETQACTQPVVASQPLIDSLRQQNYQVVIATNPIYPAEAIAQRLAWANLSPNFQDYDFVTHAENMHFAKPSPAYYAEILAHIGVEPDEAIMIGNEPNNDIIPAKTIGIHTVLTNSDQLHELLEDMSFLDNIAPQRLHQDMIAPQLKGNMGALFGMIEQVPEHYWKQHPDENEWSPLEIICHLYDKEENDHRSRLKRILKEDNPFLPHTPPPAPFEMPLCADSGTAAAQQLLHSRLETLKLIESIQQNQWSLPARHSIFGPTTLLEMAHFTAQHDRLHLKQLCQTIGNCQ